MQRRPERISSLNVERGLYVLRYVSAAGTDHPTIFVRTSPGDDGGLTIIPFPGEPADRMLRPGSLMVIAVPEATTVQITAQAASPTGSLNAELRLEPLKPGVANAEETRDVGFSVQGAAAPKQTMAVAANAGTASQQRGPVSHSVAEPSDRSGAAVSGPSGNGEIRFQAHVARRGDVVAMEGTWIGGPDAPAPIEGIAVECPAAVGEMQVQVMVSGETRWSDWLVNGAFGGSRGRATPLIGLRFRLLPAAGVEATMEGEALFLGSAIIRKEGQDLEFRSAAGLDPLLGVKLQVRREAARIVPEPSLVSTVPQSGRVRVFRASGRRSF